MNKCLKLLKIIPIQDNFTCTKFSYYSKFPQTLNVIKFLSIDNLVVAYIDKSTVATELELNHLDHKIYSAIKRIRGQEIRADVNSIHKEIVKVIDFESISKEFLNDRIKMLMQNDKKKNKNKKKTD